ncbi:MAG: aminotransferase class V-fold PLP-dependent enzyme [Gemmatimonadetes bacterium]|jgi:aromatic-L-amino-acid decarboxylase|nr:aminotransferase class V-fold PLP-dependent enzyme [Gemmatimonadota bacterium]GIT50511.1 MAG: L-2,4-diaminobutyrate decarboxylase [Gemmatimonadota bacterium]|tara:strand:- start:2383 stop:3825 length:1443 start_codon:yes stop_codon:yes gene_type:complete
MTSRAEDGGRSELEMSPEQMMASAQRAAELVIERIQNLPEEPAWRGGSRSELEAIMREEPPEEGRPSHEVIERAAHEILPIAGRVDHPRFFAFVPSSPAWPGVLADFMAAGHNIFQGTWLGASGPSMLEVVVMDWFRSWIGYPETAGGLFTSGGSAASLDGFVAAREAAGAPMQPSVYMSDQSHTALIRAATIVGVRPESVRMVPTDEHFRLDMNELHSMIVEDQKSGLTPIAICGNAGATNTGAIDPLDEIADYCESEEIWFHVDAAYGGFAILTDRGAGLLKGLERADSIAMDAHKWLFQPFECGCLMVKDIQKLEKAFSVQPEYLQDTQWGRDHPNFGDRGLQLSRSFRALKVWMSVQTFGMAAFRRSIAQGIDLAERAEAYIRESDVLHIANPASLGVVCFRVNSRAAELNNEELEEINKAVQARVIEEGVAMMSSTRLRGLYSLRLCILNHTTTWEDVRFTLAAIEDFGREAINS